MGHFYLPDGTPQHRIIGANGVERDTTLRDAKRLGLLVSVTTYLDCLAKPGLERWKTMQAVHAVITAPDVEGEGLDQKIERVLYGEKQADEEAARARELGTRVHDAIEKALTGQPFDKELEVFIDPVLVACESFGKLGWSEKILVGKGYAGKADAMFYNGNALDQSTDTITIVDFKTCKKLPKESWPEHRWQLAAYAKAWAKDETWLKIKTVNIYISTEVPGAVFVSKNPPWKPDFQTFKHIMAVWQAINDYKP